MVASETLAGLDLLKGLSDDALEAIAAVCQEESFRAGTTFFAVDRAADRFYLLLEGTVGLTISPLRGRPPLTITILNSRGQAFGWSALVGPGLYTAAAQAETDVRAIGVDAHALMSYLERNPVAGFVIMRRVAQLISQRMSELRRLFGETIRDYEHPPEAVREN